MLWINYASEKNFLNEKIFANMVGRKKKIQEFQYLIHLT